MAQNIREAIEKAQLLQRTLGKAASELGKLIDEEVELPTENSQSKMSIESEALSEDGMRLDIINYLDGAAEIDSVKPFNQKQLIKCFREIEGRKNQAEGWRGRFAQLQEANLKS